MTENEKKRDIRLQLLLVMIVALIAFCGGYDIEKDHFLDVGKMVDTVIVERWDTAFIDRPTEIVRYITRYDTVRVFGNSEQPVEPQIDIIDDSTAIIPIEQAVYSDSTENARYTAYVSGFRAALDSIQIDCKNTERVITNTITREPRRLSFGLQLGVGVSTQGVALPYFGVGAQYRLW